MTSLNGSFPGKELGEREQHLQREVDARAVELQVSQSDSNKEHKDGGAARDEASELSNMNLIVCRTLYPRLRRLDFNK